jgi:hypothetical protein
MSAKFRSPYSTVAWMSFERAETKSERRVRTRMTTVERFITLGTEVNGP